MSRNQADVLVIAAATAAATAAALWTWRACMRDGGGLSARSRRPGVGDIIIGCSSLAGLYKPLGDDVAVAAIRTSFALGFDKFDTAPHYGLGLSERRLGLALRGVTKPYKVWSKVGRVLYFLGNQPDGADIEWGNTAGHADCIFPEAPSGVLPVLDYTAAGIRRGHADSCKRMGLAEKGGIEGMRVHDADDEKRMASALAPDGAVDALCALRAEGKIKAVSVGVNQPDAALRLIRSKPLGTYDEVMLAGSWNLLDLTGHEVLVECAKRGIAVHNAGVYASGLLAGGTTFRYAEANATIAAAAARWRALADKHGVELPAAALQFSLAPAAVKLSAVGVKSAAEVEAQARWIAAKIPGAFWREALSSRLLPRGTPVPGW